MPKTGFMTALRDAMSEEMRRDDSVFLMGEDVRQAIYGSSVGMLEEFGAERVLDVPLAENGFIGAAGGAAMVGTRPIVDVTMSPFLYLAVDQIVSIIAKSRYLYGGQTHVPLVLRSCMMYNINNAAQHSDRPYPMFMNVPGLKIVMPSDPYDAKGLLKAAIRDDDPVLFFEDSSLWTSASDIPDEDYVLPLGRAAIKRPGRDVTVFACAGAVPLALQAATALASDGIDVEVIDPRTLKPLDTATILASVAKTGRFVAVDPAHRTCSVASEITATVSEYGFWDLKSPPIRVTTPDIHIPFAASMEKGLYPNVERIVAAVRQSIAQTA
jgi:acetoin:2,6-dichlorophenolindophenol oxidoreductase subunit beta